VKPELVLVLGLVVAAFGLLPPIPGDRVIGFALGVVFALGFERIAIGPVAHELVMARRRDR
jgi:hypothetical protein